MLKKKKFHPGQNVSLEDLVELVDNNINIIKDLLADWVPNSAAGILTETVPASGGIDLKIEGLGNLFIKVNKGTAYLNYDKLKIDEDFIIDLTEDLDLYGEVISLPTGLEGVTITRRDIIGIQYSEQDTSYKNIDFIDSNKNILRRTVATETEFGGKIVYVQGNRSLSPVDPDLPNDILPLARIYLRDDTIRIVATGTGTVQEGYIEDLRIPYLFNK